MIAEKKQLLVISTKPELIKTLKEGLSLHFEINIANSIHTGYNVALNLLPDIILLDQTSMRTPRNLKNLSNFKSTHFLNRCWLIMYADEDQKPELEKSFKNVVDEFYYNIISAKSLCGILVKKVYSNFSLSNYWKDSFMGLFNLIPKPVLLLKQDDVIAINDAFKQTFRVKKSEGLKLTDFVNCENKIKVKASLRNFARGKHMKASTRTSLLLKNDKERNAKISFSKLNKNQGDQFIMIIDFSGEETLVTPNIGSNSESVERCFRENSKLCDFSFTKREKEIIELLCKGYKTKEISSTLFISPKTIEKHRSNIIKRTNSDTILESIIYAINHNLIDLNPS
ncbi:response regulator transcription factor [Salegentibacter chungangensis]|uniref:Response regulator transcription factor n=1 Tax=Salegentibacter chungangensis TaxID=1335724 RepID=A0ABW3NR76_9FLAO